jgi:hemerythrin
LQLADQDGLLAAVDGLIEHCIEHFEQEEQWMRDSNFPPLHCHENEHKQVLQVVQEVKRRLVEEGDVDLPRRLADELPLWLENHIDTMDYALSHFLKTLAEHGETAAAQTTKEGSGC